MSIDLFIAGWNFDYFRDWQPEVDDVVLVSGSVSDKGTIFVESIETVCASFGFLSWVGHDIWFSPAAMPWASFGVP